MQKQVTWPINASFLRKSVKIDLIRLTHKAVKVTCMRIAPPKHEKSYVIANIRFGKLGQTQMMLTARHGSVLVSMNVVSLLYELRPRSRFLAANPLIVVRELSQCRMRSRHCSAVRNPSFWRNRISCRGM